MRKITQILLAGALLFTTTTTFAPARAQTTPFGALAFTCGSIETLALTLLFVSGFANGVYGFNFTNVDDNIEISPSSVSISTEDNGNTISGNRDYTVSVKSGVCDNLGIGAQLNFSYDLVPDSTALGVGFVSRTGTGTITGAASSGGDDSSSGGDDDSTSTDPGLGGFKLMTWQPMIPPCKIASEPVDMVGQLQLNDIDTPIQVEMQIEITPRITFRKNGIVRAATNEELQAELASDLAITEFRVNKNRSRKLKRFVRGISGRKFTLENIVVNSFADGANGNKVASVTADVAGLSNLTYKKRILRSLLGKANANTLLGAEDATIDSSSVKDLSKEKTVNLKFTTRAKKADGTNSILHKQKGSLEVKFNIDSTSSTSSN